MNHRTAILATVTAFAIVGAVCIARGQTVTPPLRVPHETGRPYQRPQISVPLPGGGVAQYDGFETMPAPPAVVDFGTAGERKAREAAFDALCKPVLQIVPGGLNRWHYGNPDCQAAFYGRGR